MDKRYDHKLVEKEMRELWERLLPYKFKGESDADNVYSIDTPPPTVSGALHIGHIFSYTQTDLVARYKRMRGFDVFYPMGFDDNGLATERFVEKKHKIRGHMLKRSEFVELCLKESQAAAKSFAELWKSVGLSIDWTKVYSTISQKVSQYSFLELYKKGLVYKKEEPALYCTSCRTTVAQAELNDLDVSSTFNDIVFATEQGRELVVATTRPELLPACVALFYHPEDGRYADLAGKEAITPVFGKKVPILADDAVDKEKGSGLVMCCTFGDQTDILWYKKHKLPFIQVVGHDGKWTEKAGVLSGLRVREARKKILELLEEGGLLKKQESIKHPVNVHERCSQEIEYLVLNQWFVKILDHKEDFLRLADEISWHPAFMKARYKDWVEHLGWDWCISRQRFYGVPFPVWYCGDCGEVILADVEELPVDPQEMQKKACPACSSGNVIPETDVMDTWNTSSLTPQLNTGWPDAKSGLRVPMSLRPQAHDIIRTWTFYTIVKAFYHQNSLPWKEIAVSGYVVAKGKEKISKSKGNAPTDPEKLLKMYPADSIRFWASSGKLGADTLFSENQFKIGNRLLTKLWNAFRFCREHIENYDGNEPKSIDPLNGWLLQNLSDAVSGYVKHFDAYEHALALDKAQGFFWNVFCDNYLELIKDRIFNPEKYSSDVIDATRYVLYKVGLGILQMFAPFVPHVTEKLYQILYVERESSVKGGAFQSLHTSIFDEKDYTADFSNEAAMTNQLVEIVGIIRKLKSEHKLSLKVALEKVSIHSKDASVLDRIASLESVLIGVTHAKAVEYSKGSEDRAGEHVLHDRDGLFEVDIFL